MSTLEQATDPGDPPKAPAGAELRLQLPMDRISAFCRKWGIRELSVFGSILRDDFSPESDVDVAVKRAVQQSRNPYRRREILGSARFVYHV